MLIGIGVNNGVTISSCTYNGVAAASVGVSSEVAPGGQKLFLYYLANPASGLNNVVVTTSDATAWEGMVATYAGVKQVIPEATATMTNTGSPVATTVTTVTDNAWLAKFIRNTTGNNTAGANTTVRGAAGAISIADTNAAQTPAGAKTLNVTFTGGGVAGAIGVSLAVAPIIYTLTAATGVFTLTGVDAILRRIYTLTAATGAFVLTGVDATLTWVERWTNATKNSSTITNETKNSSSWTNGTKNSSTFTNDTRNG